MLQGLSYTAAGLESSGDEQLQLYPSLLTPHTFISIPDFICSNTYRKQFSAEPSKNLQMVGEDGFAVLKPHVISVIPFPEHLNLLY